MAVPAMSRGSPQQPLVAFSQMPIAGTERESTPRARFIAAYRSPSRVDLDRRTAPDLEAETSSWLAWATMANGGSLGRLEPGSLDPSEALTVSEAARLVGVSEAALRRKIQSGSLLHEVGRRGGREVQLVRLFDLADEYPDVWVPGDAPAGDRGEGPGAAPEARTAEGTAGEPDRAAAAPAPPDEASAPPASEDDGAQLEAGAMRRRNHAFEVRLAALQSSNQALSEQVRDLQAQRGDLRDQCGDLRGRLTAVEKERQASTAALLMAQRRLLEIEARPAPLEVPPARWRRGGTWVALILVGGLAFVALRQVRGGRELEDLHALVAPALVRAEEDRARLAEEVERRRQAFEASLVEVREESQASRSALLGQLQELVDRSEQLTATLDSEREMSAAARGRLEVELAATRREAESARRALEDERELRVAALREGERQRGELDERLASLAEQVSASGAAAARVGEHLLERDAAWNASVARLTDELERLRAQRRLEEREERARADARIAATRWWLSRFFGFAVADLPAGEPVTVDEP